MAIRIRTDAAALARSRFATSPAFELVAALRGRASASSPVHARRWCSRALARLDAWTLQLLHALVPVDHPYVPDFLTPSPGRPRETRDGMVEAVAATPSEQVARELDVALDGRPVHPDVVASFPDERSYRAWRRPVPPVLARVLAAGEETLVVETATALGRFFDAAVAEDWPRVAAVLDADIAHRAQMAAEHGLGGALGDLGPELRWDGEELVLERPYEVLVDWAGDGVLLVPCTASTGPVLFAAERPRVPLLSYPARGTAALTARPPVRDRTAHLRVLIGSTRLRLLVLLDAPRTTQALGRLDGHTTATVSYHLGILRRSGLVTSRRSGRGVLYRRTALGDALLEGELPVGRG